MNKGTSYLIIGLLSISSALLGYQVANNSNRDLVIDPSALNGNLIPATDNKFILGSKDARWKSLQLGPGTLYIEDQTTGKQAELTVVDQALHINGANSLKIGATELTADGLKFPDGTIQATAQLVGPKGEQGEKGDTGMSGGPQGMQGPSGTSGYDPISVCVDPGDKKIIFSTCKSVKLKGTDLVILVKSK